MVYFVDTNVFLRFLLGDDIPQHQLAHRLFQKAEAGKLNLWTTDIVILEIVWTLKSFYKYPNVGIKKTVSGILALKNLQVTNSHFLLQALEDFTSKNIDFTDAYNFQLAIKEGKKILSFDDDFRKLGPVANIAAVVKSS